jgi:hypothetical protein
MGIAPCRKCEAYGDSKNDVDFAVWNDSGYICSSCCEKLQEEAEKRVLAVRGSYDAPSFDACVEAEMQSLIA